MELTLRTSERAVLRDATPEDAEALLEVERAITADGRGVVLSLEQLSDVDERRRRIQRAADARAAGGATRILVAEIASRGIVANAELQQLGPALCRHVGVLALGVHPSHQRLGLGRALMTALIEHAAATGITRLELYMRADNERALALYRSLGFEHEGTRARFIRLPDGRYVDDWIFVRSAGSPADGESTRADP